MANDGEQNALKKIMDKLTAIEQGMDRLIVIERAMENMKKSMVKLNTMEEGMKNMEKRLERIEVTCGVMNERQLRESIRRKYGERFAESFKSF